ncbi:DUF3108 domain-containing protein [Urechidicola vernalis]|uniref:DUF3108 domain-containing protein n=1 Tax=Urechidicola vernalis TaxID=3075600 RepID=A0ABU2Y5R7_9FLAO|nr:DUF3108 domain-containing protein [Urechidicola sp. P050]MDT0553392.1 DUF3108 domain-containing protein [Urechidicola sp. P050]
MSKKALFILIFLCVFLKSEAQKKAYQSGEWLKFRMHYGLINAGYASIEIKDVDEDANAYHVTGLGWTTGITKFFFPVEDDYQTWFNKDTELPYHFRRRISEGGHYKSRDIYFDQNAKTALVKDHKRKTEKTFEIDNVQDMISSFYKLRNHDISNLEIGDELKLMMFFDSETYDFRMRYLGDEVIDSKFGKIKCHKFRPLVQSGRVFEAEESLTVWVTADLNKIPIRIKADLAVGSLKADLDEFKGLANSFNIIFEK